MAPFSARAISEAPPPKALTFTAPCGLLAYLTTIG